MLTQFVVVSFAAFIGYQLFRLWLPFVPLTVRTAPLIAYAISWGFTWFFRPSFIVAIAATGGVAVLNKITDVSSPEPARFPVRLHRRQQPASREVRERIPAL